MSELIWIILEYVSVYVVWVMSPSVYNTSDVDIFIFLFFFNVLMKLVLGGLGKPYMLIIGVYLK